MAFTRDQLQAGFRLGDCLVQPSHNRISRGAGSVRVEPRVMEMLMCLAQHAGDVVSRDALYQAVWGELVLTDQAVTNCISELRHHLGDDRTTQRVIETIPKRGYRLVVPVEPGGEPAAALPPAVAPQPVAPPIATPPAAEPAAADPPAAAPPAARRWLMAAGLLAILALAGGLVWLARDPGAPAPSVVVVPFDNAAGDETLDYLRLALPDEIATLLTRSPRLTVRPLDFLRTDDPLTEARTRGVAHVISGRYYLEPGAQLAVAVEAQHAGQQRVVWRALVTAPADDLLTLRARLSDRVQQGLLPVLGAAGGAAPGPAPEYDAAYRLYLHSLAVPRQPQPTERAIAMLEQAVALDPGFAQAWAALGLRYYDHGNYSTGGDAARRQSLAANRQALALDPELVPAARQMVTHLAEAGDLEAAYREAQRLARRDDSSAVSHFALAYVLRFGGLLKPAQQHCELARERDPYEPRLRSCAYAYLYDGQLSRALEFLAVDEGSYFVQWGTILYHLRRQDSAAALSMVRQAAPDATRRLMEPCLEGVRRPALDDAAAAFTDYWGRAGDPEAPYAVAPILDYCGYPEAALALLERAVDGGFCAFPALDRDPAWVGLRDHPEFRRIRGKAMACHDRFRRMVASYTPAADPQPR